MKINKTSFLKGMLLGSVLFVLGIFISSHTEYGISANGGSECDQSADCQLVDNPGNGGNRTADGELEKVVLKAGTQFFQFNQGDNDNGCYRVRVNSNQVEWQKYGDGPDCKDISHMQLWRVQNQEEPQDPPQDPEPSCSPSPTQEPEPQTEVPSVNPPSFNSCVNQSTIGDYTHYDYGVHQIVGGALQEGSDDVYSLGGNYLQCFCSVEDNGIQTFWWQVDGANQADLDYYTANGWYLQNGVQWNLGDHTYLAKNINYYCGEPTPTLTPTPTQTPTPTTTTTPTPTPEDEPESRCEGLSASPTSGVAPLTVRFIGSGYDEDGEIKLYKFNFGDDSDGQPQIWEQEDSTAYHRYQYEGTYYASLAVEDSRGNWRNGENDCKIEITVTSEPQVLGTSTTTELPKTGAPVTIALGIISLTSVGAYLRKKFIVD